VTVVQQLSAFGGFQLESPKKAAFAAVLRLPFAIAGAVFPADIASVTSQPGDFPRHFTAWLASIAIGGSL
jgi:hypothetical protein